MSLLIHAIICHWGRLIQSSMPHKAQLSKLLHHWTEHLRYHSPTHNRPGPDRYCVCRCVGIISRHRTDHKTTYILFQRCIAHQWLDISFVNQTQFKKGQRELESHPSTPKIEDVYGRSRKQVSKGGENNCIPRYLWDEITCSCPWYLFRLLN